MTWERWLLEGCAALGIFDPVTAGETQTFPESDPNAIPSHFICLLWPGKRGRVSPGTPGLWQSPGAAARTRAASLVGGTRVYLPFHHLITVPCHVAGASPWAASPV